MENNVYVHEDGRNVLQDDPKNDVGKNKNMVKSYIKGNV